jgi:hypothetical protein
MMRFSKLSSLSALGGLPEGNRIRSALREQGAAAILALVSSVLLASTVGCSGDTIPSPLRATPPGGGPKIVWDLSQRPLPNIPLPNDMATFPDPTSRTGLRVNASTVAPTHMDRIARSGLDDMEGWGTYEPVTVAFEKEDGADPRAPAIDLADLARRMQKDDSDFSNDAIYLIDLTSGLPIPLDVGDGNFPLSASDPTLYYPNDVKLAEGAQNVLFETNEEGAGLTQSQYTPALDQDFDGVLDHPNAFGPPGEVPGVDNIIGWYELETDTVRARPLLPLNEKTEYAVVITDRLHGPDGQPARSPFQAVYAAEQRSSVARVGAAINDPRRQAYFGDIAGTGLDHVAFAWTFTTEPVQEDMRLLRDGLYGQGPFAHFSTEYPPKVELFRAVGKSEQDANEPNGWQELPECADLSKRLYMVKFDDVKATLDEFFTQVFNYSGPRATLLEDVVTSIDHVVIGTFQSPYLMGDPASPDPDTQFHVNFKTGEGPVQPDAVHFYITVPKTTATAHQPFNVAFWGHGVTGHDDETIVYAGHYAKQGIAMIGIDAPEHGLVLDNVTRKLATNFLAQACVAPWINGVDNGRAHDLNFDGVPDSGGLWWTAHMFHTRDNVRQAILDSMQATRVLRSFDGKSHADQDYNGDGDSTNDLAGDFDGDGTVDLGGPSAKYFAAGESLGGLLSEIQGGIDPFIVASAPVSGGGGGGLDIAPRSYGVAEPVLLQVLSPLVVGVPASDRPADTSGKKTLCTGDQRSVRFFVNDLTGSKELEIACVDAKDLGPKMTLVLTNVATGERRCARTLDSQGRFRLPIPASIGDKLDLQVYPAPDVVDDYKNCDVPASVAPGRRINTWEQPLIGPTPTADPNAACPPDATSGCQQFRETFYPVGSDLIAPQEGLGLSRQTPDFRRLLDLVQAAFDPADPINYAPYYMLRPLLGIDGSPVPPHALLGVNTVGDGYVNVASGNAFARAAGALPFLPPSAVKAFPDYGDYVTADALYAGWGGKTADRVLIDNDMLEGVARFGRTPAGPTCDVNFAPSGVCTPAPSKSVMVCQDSLYDTDWLAEGLDKYDQQHLMVPLRVARDATVRPVDPASVAAAWAPRVAGAPFSPDTAAWSSPLVAELNVYFLPLGQHSFDAGDPCLAFDMATYVSGTMARFFATQGTDLYYLSHPSTHRCMADRSCPLFQ